MKTNRRRFVKTNVLGTLAAALPFSMQCAEAARPGSGNPNPRYGRLNEVLAQPVLKRELFPDPVLIESLELLRYRNKFLCRVRSRDGAEGMSVAHSV